MEEINTLKQRIEELENKFKLLNNNFTIPFDIGEAFKARTKMLPDAFNNIPLASIASPSGGITQDNIARTAIDDIITRLETLGLVTPN